MGRLLSWSYVVAALVVLTGCGRRCDAEALNELATTLESADAATRLAAVDRFAHVCPSMPPEIYGRLRASYGTMPPDQAATMLAGMSSNGPWADARRRACRASDEELRAAASAATNSAAAVYEACRFERFRLLEADEPFSIGDFEAFVLYSWLRSRWTAHAVARRVSRALVTATGPLDHVVARCIDTNEGCDGAFARLGITPPELGLNMESGTEKVLIVVVAESAADLRADRVFGIAPRELPTGDGHDHTVTALRDWLRSREASEEHRLVLIADARLDFHGALDLLQTAGQVGVLDLGLAGRASSPGSGHHEMSAVGPRTWLRSRELGDIIGGPRPTTLSLGPDALRVQGGKQAPASFDLDGDCGNAEACVDVSAAAADVAVRSEGRDARFFELRASPGVSFGNAMALGAAVIGDDCRALEIPDGVDVGPRCRFARVQLNGHPPISWRTPLLDTLALGDPSARPRSEEHTQGPSSEDLLARFEAAKEKILGCAAADEWVTGAVADGRPIVMVFAAAAGDDTEMLVKTNEMSPPEQLPWASEDLTRCMAAAMKMKVPDASVSTTDFILNREQMYLSIPLKFGAPPQ